MHILITTWYCVKFMFSTGKSDFQKFRGSKLHEGEAISKIVAGVGIKGGVENSEGGGQPSGKLWTHSSSPGPVQAYHPHILLGVLGDILAANIPAVHGTDLLHQLSWKVHSDPLQHCWVGGTLPQTLRVSLQGQVRRHFSCLDKLHLCYRFLILFRKPEYLYWNDMKSCTYITPPNLVKSY